MTEWERLVYEAKEKCAGCRETWSLYAYGVSKERTVHLGAVRCQALDERRKIRALTPASG